MKKILLALAMSAIFMACTKSNSTPAPAGGQHIYLKSVDPSTFIYVHSLQMSNEVNIPGDFPTMNAVLQPSIKGYTDLIVSVNVPGSGYHIVLKQSDKVLNDFAIDYQHGVIRFQALSLEKADLYLYITK